MMSDSIFSSGELDVDGTRKPAVAMGWHPLAVLGFGNWIAYDEGMIIYLLGLGTATNPLPASAWNYWTSDISGQLITDNPSSSSPPVWTRILPLLIDFRHAADAYMNSRAALTSLNSQRAALAQPIICIDNPLGWVGYAAMFGDDRF